MEIRNSSIRSLMKSSGVWVTLKHCGLRILMSSLLDPVLILDINTCSTQEVRDFLIIGELALLGKFPCELIAITGTNGKSTTTAWAGYLLEELNHDAFIGGNLGDPITGWALDGYPGKSGVLELSSYQLETAFGFAPKVSVMTNLASDHAARYSTDTEYFPSEVSDLPLSEL